MELFTISQPSTIPFVSTDPSDPNVGQSWILSKGTPIGLLAAITRTTYFLRIQTPTGIVQLPLA